MKSTLFGTCVFFLPLLSNVVLAEDGLKCVTLSGTDPAQEVETTTTTKTNEGTAEQTITFTPTVTITSAEVITTATVSSTVVTTITGPGTSGGTFTVTLTNTNTITETSTQLNATTSFSTTTVTSTSTSTVPVRSGFIPVESSLPGASLERSQPRQFSKRGKQCKPRGSTYPTLPSTTTGGASYPTSTGEGEPCLPPAYGSLYPSKVVCETTVGAVGTSTVTSTASATTITASAATLTETTVTTVTSTSSVAGEGVTSTVTTSTTVPTTTTTVTTLGTTITATATATVNGPAVSVFAACQGTANYATYFNNSPISQALAFNMTVDLLPVNDYTSCCNACFGSAKCTAFAFVRPNSICYSLTTTFDTCAQPNQYSITAQYNTTAGSNPSFVLGNGNCARFDRSAATQ